MNKTFDEGVGMALRWRIDGTLICAAKSEAEEDDIYINDDLHYELSVLHHLPFPDKDEADTGLWHWDTMKEGVW